MQRLPLPTIWICPICGTDYDEETARCSGRACDGVGVPVAVPQITDEMVDLAVIAYNEWPVDHPIHELGRQDSRWQAMRRALLAIADPESFAAADRYTRVLRAEWDK